MQSDTAAAIEQPPFFETADSELDNLANRLAEVLNSIDSVTVRYSSTSARPSAGQQPQEPRPDPPNLTAKINRRIRNLESVTSELEAATQLLDRAVR